MSSAINSPFVDGGVAGDAIRNITGTTPVTVTLELHSEGALYIINHTNTNVNYGGSWGSGNIALDLSRVVPVGPENSPRTLSVLYWRRVA